MKNKNFITLGTSNEVDTCDCCGKTGLKRTVVLGRTDADGTVMAVEHFGTTCANRATGNAGTAGTAKKAGGFAGTVSDANAIRLTRIAASLDRQAERAMSFHDAESKAFARECRVKARAIRSAAA